jgi:hypothetical protein
VLGDLRAQRVLEQRLECGQHLFRRQLRRRAGVVVAHRHIGGLPGLDCEGQADELRALRIQAGGLGVEGEGRRAFEHADPVRQALARGDQLVVLLAPAVQAVPRAQRRRRHGRGDVGRTAADFGQRLLEAVARVQAAQRLDVRRLQRQLGRADRQLAVGLDRDQFAVQRQPRQRGAQVLADLAADLAGVRDDILQAVVLRQPFRGGLRPALVDTGHVVHRVAHQREVIDDALRAHAELDLDAGGIQALAGHRVEPLDARTHQLRQILVAGRDDHAHARRMALGGERADHIVGLDPGLAQDRHADRLDDLQQRLDLQPQVLGHRGRFAL